MISCTEFIPAYSELFSFIHREHGRGEVERLWDYLFKPDGDGIPLIRFIEKEGLRGCFSYWSGTLNEEAADFTLYLNEKAGWFMLDMHRCPSKGRLLELKEDLGLEPYPYYCLHCDHYRSAVEKAGFEYIYNFTGTDRASCALTVFDPKVFDGRIIPDENTKIMTRSSSDNEYFHKDFHSSMNMGIGYLAEKFGKAEAEKYLLSFTENAYRRLLGQIRERGLEAIAEKIRDTYEKEKAPEAVSMTLGENSLSVSVAFCPAVRHLKETGRLVSPFFYLTTETVMERLAEEAGAKFEMLSYDEKTGAAEYRFTIN